MRVICWLLLTLVVRATTEAVLALDFESPADTERTFGFTAALAPGVHGQAAVIDGSHWLTPALRQKLSPEAGTVAAWVQLVERPPSGYLLRWLSAGEHVGITWADNHPMVLAKSRQAAPDPIEAGDWHHWAYVWNGADRQLYLDGHCVIEAEHGELTDPPGIMLRNETAGGTWLVDDLRLYAAALTAPEIAAIIGAAPAVPVVYDERQLVVNPLLVQGTHTRPTDAVPPGWRFLPGDNTAIMSANGVHLATTGDQVLSVLATIRRGSVRPGRPYRLGLRYRLTAGGATVRLRFRNQVDRGTREFVLPDNPAGTRQFFYAVAPEDYDVGIYYLEVLIEGNGAVMDVLGAYCREVAAEEVAGLDLAVREPQLDLAQHVVPDETWIAALPADLELLPTADRRAAWDRSDLPGRVDLAIANPGGSVLIENDIRELFAKLRGTTGRIRLAGSGAGERTPHGAGDDPLPPRSIHGIALLCGVGAVDTGLGSWQHEHLLAIAGDFLAGRFIPFWSQQRDAEPLFYHTAPGVLVSGYRAGDRLLLVLVNTTNQELGKMGDLYVDHRRLFDFKSGDTGGMLNRGAIVATNPETGARLKAKWNRNGGGWIDDWYFNIAIPPGDYRLLTVEVPQ